jgi:Fe-S cluster assembly iron-binding protein IscA
LCLSVDRLLDGDLIVEAEGLTFIISRETLELVGDVTISYTDEEGKKGFMLRSSKPVSEWEGFGVCQIRPPDLRS